VDDLIIGINWYTGRNSRIMLNYVMADIDEGGAESNYDALMLRFQVDF
jgi:phosphate-selective porin